MLGAAYCADAGMGGCMLVCGRCLLINVEGWRVWHGGWEVHVGVFGGKRWVGGACGVSGGMVVGTPCGCI
jgi:hypothetical protein